ncbi:hypothetical protein Tco_0495780 [Tanacetum coccineum]
MTRFKDLLQKVPHHGIDLWLQVQIFYDHVTPATRRTINQSAGGKLRDRNAKKSRALLEDLALYDNKSWNDPRDFTKPVKAISLPQDVPSTSDRRLIELKNQVQRLMKAHIALMQPTQVNKITSSCKICSGLHDTHYCMENLEQAFVEYASSHIDKARGKWYTFKPEKNNFDDTYNLSWKSHPNLRWRPKILKIISHTYLTGSNPTVQSRTAPSTTILKVLTINQILKDWCPTSWHLKTLDYPSLKPILVLSARSYPTEDP